MINWALVILCAEFSGAAYAEALKALGDGAVRDFRIVEGVE